MPSFQKIETLPEANYLSIAVDELKNKSSLKIKTADLVKFNLGLAYFIVLIFLIAKLFLG